MTQLSVIIASFNGAQRIGIQLEALATQHDPPPFEVIVVDNGSTDGLAEAVRQWQDRLSVRVVSASAEQGTSYARNVGIAAAQSDLIAFCDDDDVVGSGWVASAVRSLELAPFVTGAVTDISADQFTSVDHVRSLVPEPAEFQPVHPVEGFDSYPILMGGNCAIRRDLALQLQGFDQRFFPGAEDNDLALRYLAMGGQLLRAPSMVVAARLRATSAGAFKRSFDGGSMHMLLCQVHNLWQVSPSVRNPDFRLDLLKVAIAAGRGVVRRDTDWRGIISRFGLRLGQVSGWLRFSLARQCPPARLGIGLADSQPATTTNE